MIIAIDGPSGAGKSTVSQAVAKNMGFSCLDTGAMYRSIALAALREGVSLDDAEGLGEIARTHRISFGHEVGDPVPKQVFVDGREVTREIRTPEIDQAVSRVSSAPAVRTALVDQQRRIGNAGNYVVEGRDIGTVVFPQAALKVFMTASAEERARRRVAQNKARGIASDYDTILNGIIARDEQDSSRDASPLRPADDALMLDTTDLTIDQVIERICTEARKRENA
ncbi:MAG: (d)CMP kinase [Eggerthellaceae bacterium]|jgi:cytidylate kinase